MSKFTNLQDVERIKFIENLTLEYNLSTVAIEKDWWISTVLRALFALPYAENLSFKEHRRIFIGLKGFDYNTLAPQSIKIVPPDSIIPIWKTDYETMRETMIYGESLPFNKLMDRIKQLNEKINKVEW